MRGKIEKIEAMKMPHGQKWIIGGEKVTIWGAKARAGSDFIYREGDEVQFEPDVEAEGQYKGSKSVFVARVEYINHELPQEIKDIEFPPQESPKEPTKDEWYEKEMRGHRRACCAIASGLMTEREKESYTEMDVDRVNMVMLTANKLMQYVEHNRFDDPMDIPATILEK